MQTPFSLTAQYTNVQLMVIIYAREINMTGKDLFHYTVHKIPDDILLN
jgi:hypothetical protein